MANAPWESLVRQRIEESVAVKKSLLEGRLVDALVEVAELVLRALQGGGKVIFCGNGGSAADSTHLAAEFVGRLRLDRAPLPALSLPDNVAALTAISNDQDYDDSFARQVRALGRSGDVLVALSTSGRSANVLAAVSAAHEVGLTTVGFVSAEGGPLARLAQYPLRMPADETTRVQEATMLLGHTLCELVEAEFASSSA
jgi:D-sedoheptulose 7-phosphate isomerase